MDFIYVSGPISENVRKLEAFKTGSDRPGVNRGSSMLLVRLSHTTVAGTGTGKEGPCLSSQDGFCGRSGSTIVSGSLRAKKIRHRRRRSLCKSVKGKCFPLLSSWES
jgi:hypothetical protein